MPEKKGFLNTSFLLITLMPLLWVSLASETWAASPEKNARAWLDQMSRSMRELNYQGEFTYEHASQITTLQIFHAVKEGVEYERLVHLDGEPREIVRRGHELNCIHPGTQMMRLHGDYAGNPVELLAESLSPSAALLDEYYDFDLAGGYRVAGRHAVQISIKPKDGYRHAHRLFLDRETGLLLKSLLLDSQNHPLERFQFTHIEIGAEINEKDLQAKADGHLYAHHHDAVGQEKTPVREGLNWTVRWVPAGFLKTKSGLQRSLDGDAQSLGSYMYTDGLSAFTVFLEHSNEPIAGDGIARRGATVAFTRQLVHKSDKYLVTVVGEIPSLTAEKVASSVWAN